MQDVLQQTFYQTEFKVEQGSVIFWTDKDFGLVTMPPPLTSKSLSAHTMFWLITSGSDRRWIKGWRTEQLNISRVKVLTEPENYSNVWVTPVVCYYIKLLQRYDKLLFKDIWFHMHIAKDWEARLHPLLTFYVTNT